MQSKGVNLVFDNCLYLVCSFGYFTPVSKLKVIGQLAMEILYFKDLGDTKVSSRMQFG